MPTVTCPYGCGWSYSSILEHTAELAREAHIVVCVCSPRHPEPTEDL